jgi:hypothetical protein
VPRVHWLDGAAILTNTLDASAAAVHPVFCIAPGKAPGQGANAQNRNYQLAQSQTELNDRTGHQYARMNATNDPVDISLVHGGDAGIEPADQEWIRLTMSEARKTPEINASSINGCYPSR